MIGIEQPLLADLAANQREDYESHSSWSVCIWCGLQFEFRAEIRHNNSPRKAKGGAPVAIVRLVPLAAADFAH